MPGIKLSATPSAPRQAMLPQIPSFGRPSAMHSDDPLTEARLGQLPSSTTHPLYPLVKHNPHIMWCDVWVWASALQPHTHTFTHSHTFTITCTCCYDEIKGAQDRKI